MQHLPIHPFLLHPLTGLPLRAIGLRPDGSPLWPIMGGDGTDDDANDDKSGADGADDKNDGDDSGSGDDQDDDGKVDWKAKFEAEQRHKRNLERKAKKDAATIERLTGKKPEGGSKDDGDQDKPDEEKIRAEAKAEAAREVLHGRVEDKIEAKARAFADPEDAVAVLLRAHDHDDFLDDNKIDVEAITDALKELGEKKPHLLAQGGKKFEGDADQGPRKEDKGRPKSLGDAISRAYQKR